MRKKLRKLINFGAIPLTAIGLGLSTGLTTKRHAFHKALEQYNEEENSAIADNAYNQGIYDALAKTSSLKSFAKSPITHNTLYASSLLGGGIGAFLLGKKIQEANNRKFAKKFNEYNKQENMYITNEAYREGFNDVLNKTASVFSKYISSMENFSNKIFPRRDLKIREDLDPEELSRRHRVNELYKVKYPTHRDMIDDIFVYGPPVAALGGSLVASSILSANKEIAKKALRNKLLIGGGSLLGVGTAGTIYGLGKNND